MRRTMSRFIILLSIIILTFLITPAFAKDILIKDAPIDSITTGVGKDGNPYVRIIITEKRTLSGVEYDAGTPVMAFRGQVDAALKLQDGDTLSCIAAERFWNGRKSYTILKLLE